MFWDNYVKLCASLDKTPNAVAKEIGLSSGSVTAWKNGSIPYIKTVAKIADYFGVSPDDLLEEQKEKAPGISSEGLTDSERELLAMWRTLSPEEQVAQMAVWKARANRK